MKVTVILCTYNRSRTLVKALESVANLIAPPSLEWEVLVVDNNSHDDTRRVIEQFCTRFPGRFLYLFEPQQGKSYALNTGIQNASGEILAFVDDDVTVEPHWLGNLTLGIEGDEWAGAGGRILLEWPESIPEWLSVEGPYSRHVFPGFDQGDQTKELEGPPFGTNMAFRKGVFEKYGAFRTDLGPNPNSEIRNEDTEFGRRIIGAGERLRYVPSAIVYHPVPAERVNKDHFVKWYFDKGRGDAREFPVGRVHLLCSFAAWTLRWATAREPRVRFYRRLVVAEKAGQLKECFFRFLG